MQPKKIRYTLTYAGTDYILDNAPDGWDENLIKWGRSEKYYGLFRSFSIPLGFVGDGRAVVRRAYYTDGVEALVTMKIERLKSLDWTYETWYTGELDFSTYKEEKSKVTLNIMEGGVSKYLKANEGKEYNVVIGAINPTLSFRLDSVTTEEHAYLDLMPVFEWLVDQVTEGGVTAGTYLVKSDLLDSLETSVVMSTGYCMRTDTDWQGLIKTSIEQFFKSLNTIECVGIGIEVDPGTGKDVIVLEHRDYFYDSTVEIVDLGTISELKISCAKDNLFNEIKIGFPDQSYDEDLTPNNALFEDCGNSSFALPIHKVQSKLEAVATYRADWWGMWEIFSLYAAVIDAQNSDSDIFLVKLENAGGFYVPETGFVSKTSGGGTTIMNDTYFSPHRLLTKWKKLLVSVCDSLGNVHLDFVGSNVDNLRNLTYAYPSLVTPLDEAGIFAILTSDDRIYKPIYFEFKAPSDVTMTTLMQTYGNGYVSFMWNGVTFQGFVIDVGANPDKRKSLEWKLLATPACDLLDLLPVISS